MTDRPVSPAAAGRHRAVDGTGQISRVPHLPGLDGMRALAVVAVIVYHANAGWLPGGFLGVEVFFVISGYLITLLLIAEHERSGTVSLREFWKRRFRRLLPALVLLLALLMVYLAVFHRVAQGRVRGDIVAGLGYVTNWYQIWVGAGYTAAEAFAPLRHLWSLAVEEQFYLVWPLVMVLLLRRGRAWLPRVSMWLVGYAVLMAVLMAVLYAGGDIDSTCSPETMRGYWEIAGRCISINDALYLNTFTRAGGIMLGAALAMVWRPVAVMRGPLRTKGRLLDLVAVIGLLIVALLTWFVHLAEPAETILTGSRFDPWLYRGGLFVVGVATVMMIAAATHRGALFGRVLGMPALSWIGTRSYGLYLFHWPIYQIIRDEAGVRMSLGQFVLAMVFTVPLTEVSYRLVEMPVRRHGLRGLFGTARRSVGALGPVWGRRAAVGGAVFGLVVAVAGVSVAIAPNRCVGVVECANEAGREVVAGGGEGAGAGSGGITPTATTVPVDAGTGSTVPSATLVPITTVVTTAAPTTTVPIDARPPYAIGESVMLGAAPQLAAGGFAVNAEESRQGETTARVVGQLRAGGQIGRTVVLQVGTNGPVSAATYAEIMSYLPADEVTRVVFLTVTANKGWIAENNRLIWSLQGQYSNVTVLDWGGLVESGQVPGIANDGIHLATAAAKQTYANYIFGMIGRNDLIQPVAG